MPERDPIALETMTTRRMVPFRYDADTQLFYFGNASYLAYELPLSGQLHQEGRNGRLEDTEARLAGVAFAASFNRIHSLEPADAFFEQHWSDALRVETEEVMQDVYEEVRLREEDVTDWRARRHEFFAQISAPEQDAGAYAIFLQTSGICPCFKPASSYDTSFWPERVMTYHEHNVDSVARRASLFAGIGYIAQQAYRSAPVIQ